MLYIENFDCGCVKWSFDYCKELGDFPFIVCHHCPFMKYILSSLYDSKIIKWISIVHHRKMVNDSYIKDNIILNEKLKELNILNSNFKM